MNINYRFANQKDVANLIDVFKEDNTIVSKKSLTEFLNQKDTLIYIALLNDVIIAVLYGYFMTRPDGSNMCYIHSLFVSKAYRKRGIASKLINDMFAYSKSIDCTKMWLIADQNNKAAIYLYKKCGGEITEGGSYVFNFKNNSSHIERTLK